MRYRGLVGFGLGLVLGLVLAGVLGPALAATACEPGMRLFSHELLATEPVCVPVDPKRIAFIDATVALAVALDIPSVTRSYYFDMILRDFPGLAKRVDLDAMTDVGNTWEMSGEPLLLAQPDVVVSSIYWEAANGFAADIAPTVILDPDRSVSWRDIPAAIAQLFGCEAEQQALDAALDERVAAFKAAFAASGKGATFNFVQVESPEQFWVFTSRTFGPELVLSTGLRFADAVLSPEESAKVANGGAFAYPVSLEQTDLLEADHIFIYANNAGESAEKLLNGNPIGQRFAAAHAGNIHYLKGEYWFNASAFAAHRVIDDLFRDVLGQDPAVVSPNPYADSYAMP